MVEEKDDLEALLRRAKDREKQYDWRGAAESYERAFDLTSVDDSSKRGGILEKQGYSLYKAALQSDGEGQFRELIRKAIICYVKTKTYYSKLPESEGISFVKRSDAMIAFLRYWQASTATEKRTLVREAWQKATEAMEGFDENAKATEYGITYNQLATSAVIAHHYAEDFDSAKAFLQSGARSGERAIDLLSGNADPIELTKAYIRTCGFLTALGMGFVDTTCRHQGDEKALAYWQRATEISAEDAFTEMPSLLLVSDLPELFQKEQATETLNRALDIGRASRDRLLVGAVLAALAGRASWAIVSSGDSEESEILSRTSLQNAAEANREFSSISFTWPYCYWDMWCHVPEPFVYGILAYLENDTAKKREYAQKAVKVYPRALKLAIESEYPNLVYFVQHAFGHALTSLAKTETDVATKQDLLEKSVELRKLAIRGTEEFERYSNWSPGVDQSLLAEAEFELSTLAQATIDRTKMLRDAIDRKKNSLELLLKSIAVDFTGEDLQSRYPIVGHWLLQYSSWLELLHKLDNDKTNLRTSTEAIEKAAEMFRKSGVPSLTAECYWKAAQVHIDLDDHAKASDRFEHAAEQYKKAAERVPRLKEFFLEYQSYMKAWVEIEQARHHYARHQSGISREHYENAAELLGSTKKWGHLSPNYRAWSELERAEQLSRRDSLEEALDAFQRAGSLFGASRSSLMEASAKIEEPGERTMTTALISAAEWRKSYCEGRAMLEEARLIGRRGDLSASADKFDSATRVFRDISEKLKDEHDRKEIQLIVTLSKAWHAMTKAEAEASAKSYADASGLFEEARELSSFESEKLLLMGHSRFCKALAAGIEFEDTEDPVLHSTATQQLESAAKYYLKAGSEDASEYANGSKLLFDAYMFMSKARREDDLEKKAKLYVMAEKVLQASATSFGQSRHVGRRDEVIKLLSKVKRDRELAVSLGEAFRAPDITSSTVAFSAPSPTYEKAVGVERFEHADIQATLVTKPKELHVGEEFSLDIELVNAGRGPAQLTKVEESVPKGFVVVQEPEKYRMEDGLINLRGRRLDALKTEDVKLVLKPTAKGNFRLKPRIMYLDETGACKSCEPTPISVSVKEMGISGWIRGT